MPWSSVPECSSVAYDVETQESAHEKEEQEVVIDDCEQQHPAECRTGRSLLLT